MSILFITGPSVSAMSPSKVKYHCVHSKQELRELLKVESLDNMFAKNELIEHLDDIRTVLDNSEPNEAHQLITEMIEHYGGNVITNNVDNLHERSGLDSRNVFHPLGSLFEGYKKDYPDVLDVFLQGEQFREPTTLQAREFYDSDVVVFVNEYPDPNYIIPYIDETASVYVLGDDAEFIADVLQDSPISDITVIYGELLSGLKQLKELLKND